MEIYVVRSGDTLERIARRYGLTAAALQAVNQLPNPDQLVVGQAILIPTGAPEVLRYTVQRGDTLSVIAQTFNTTVTAIAQANQITNPNLLNVGQVLTIPGWSQVRYTVRAGDTLSQIASRYNVTVNQLAKVNAIANPSLINVGQVLIIPQPGPAVAPKSTIEVFAYVQTANLSGLERSLAQIGRYWTYGSIFQFPVNASGDITAPANLEREVAVLKNYNVQPVVTLTNWGPTGFESELARAIIGNETVKARVITNLLALLSRYGLGGVNVDFENMHPEDRQLYNNFIREIAAALRPRNYGVSVAVPPKFSDLPTASWVGAFDYAALGQAADFIFLMTYEWGWIGGPPMAIAPINLVRRALNYALTQIPANKLIQGIPLYGYDWPVPQTPEKLATPVDLVNVYSLAQRYNAAINYDTTAQAPWFRYRDAAGQQHEVWFEDARSLAAKYDLAKELKLRGVGYWSYVNEPYGSAQNWELLNERFQVSKYPAGA